MKSEDVWGCGVCESGIIIVWGLVDLNIKKIILKFVF